jgi:hypothetical protein
VPGGDLDVPQVHASIQHGRDKGVAEHMRVRPGDPHTSGLSQAPQAAGRSMAVHPDAAAVEQDWPADAGADRAVDSLPGRWRERDEDDLGALAAHAHHPVAVLFAEVGNVSPVASKIRRPSKPSMSTSAKSDVFDDSRDAVSRASNCRWVNPRVGDSGGTEGRRTCSAGECSSRPSITQVG